MKPIVIMYLSKSFYQFGNDSIEDLDRRLQSPTGEYSLLIVPSTDDRTTVEVFPKFILTEDKEAYESVIATQTSLQEEVAKLSGFVSKFMDGAS